MPLNKFALPAHSNLRHPLSQANVIVVFIIGLVMCAINFFDLQSIKGTSFRYVQYGYLIAGILLAFPFSFRTGGGFVFPVQLLFFSVFISIFISTLTREQQIADSIIGTVPVLVWAIFFFLRSVDFPVDYIERIVVGYGLLYLVLYFFQFANPNKNYFIDLETIDTSRGIVRIVFPGRGLFYLTVFIAITKLTSNKNKKGFWLFFALMGILVTFMQVTRQFIFGALLMYLIHFMKQVNAVKKLMMLAVVTACGIYILNSENSIVTGLKETQEQTQELGSDYVRVQAAAFFVRDFSFTGFNRIFGNGVPYGETSPYLAKVGYYIENNGFWLSDVGLIAVYVMFGIFAVLGYLLIWKKSFTINVPDKYLYVKYYLWFLLTTCLTSDTIYSPNDLIATVFVIYIYQKVYESQGAKGDVNL